LSFETDFIFKIIVRSVTKKIYFLAFIKVFTSQDTGNFCLPARQPAGIQKNRSPQNVGALGIEPSLRPPHGCVLPVYYAPVKFIFPGLL